MTTETNTEAKARETQARAAQWTADYVSALHGALIVNGFDFATATQLTCAKLSSCD